MTSRLHNWWQWLLSAPASQQFRRKIVSRTPQVTWESGLVTELVRLECGHEVVVKYMRVEMIECEECECQKKL